VIARARLVLVVSVVIAIVLVGTKIPLGQLSAESAATSHYSTELAQMQSQNRAIVAQIRALGTDNEIATIAHGEYGLIHPGQRALVIFPSAGSAAGKGSEEGPLSDTHLPSGDIVPSDLDTAPPAGAIGGNATDGSGSDFEAVLQRLEFWRWAF
jgi:cell division protein FtsB